MYLLGANVSNSTIHSIIRKNVQKYSNYLFQDDPRRSLDSHSAAKKPFPGNNNIAGYTELFQEI